MTNIKPWSILRTLQHTCRVYYEHYNKEYITNITTKIILRTLQYRVYYKHYNIKFITKITTLSIILRTSQRRLLRTLLHRVYYEHYNIELEPTIRGST